MVHKKKLTKNEQLLEYQFEEIINFSKSDFGNKCDNFHKMPKRESNDRVYCLRYTIKENWGVLIEENIKELLERIEKRAKKIENFSGVVWDLNSIKKKLSITEYESDELRKIYITTLAKIKTSIKSKIDLEKYKVKEKKKVILVNIGVAIVTGTIFFLLGYLIK